MVVPLRVSEVVMLIGVVRLQHESIQVRSLCRSEWKGMEANGKRQT